jgi:hypothetical protein
LSCTGWRDVFCYAGRGHRRTEGKTKEYDAEAYLAMANCDTLKLWGTLRVRAALGPEREQADGILFKGGPQFLASIEKVGIDRVSY